MKATILILVPLLVSATQLDAVKRHDEIPNNPLSAAKCKLTLNHHKLRGECEVPAGQDKGKVVKSVIDLDGCFENVGGIMNFKNQGWFSSSCSCTLDQDTWLNCMCDMGPGAQSDRNFPNGKHPNNINLDDPEVMQVKLNNGILACGQYVGVIDTGLPSDGDDLNGGSVISLISSSPKKTYTKHGTRPSLSVTHTATGVFSYIGKTTSAKTAKPAKATKSTHKETKYFITKRDL